MRLYDNDAYREDFMALVYGMLMSDGTNDRANQIISAFDCATAVEAEPLTPNAPLTLEQLREMDGEPVWIEFADGYKYYNGWALVQVGAKSTNVIYLIRNNGSVLHPQVELDCGGKIYRRKPENGTACICKEEKNET